MQPDLRRTRATSLTDDELILLDVMFEGGAPLRLLRQSVFQDQWNRRPHHLDDRQLRETIDRFCESSVLASESLFIGNQNQTYYGVTPHGGALWESERTPLWDRYAMDQYGQTSSRKQIVSICALSADVRDEFWRIGCDTQMWSSDVRRVRFGQMARHTLIPWKKFPQIHFAVAIVNDGDPGRMCNWFRYEAERTWWRGVSELQKFLEPVT